MLADFCTASSSHFLDITNIGSHQSAPLQYFTLKQRCACNCVAMVGDSLGRWQKLILSVGAMHASSPACFLLGSLPALLLPPALFPGSPNASLRSSRQKCSPLGTHCIRIYSISVNVLRVLTLCFPRICGELSAGRWTLRIFLVCLFICWKQ